MTTPLQDFFTYNLQANLDLLDNCAPLEDAVLAATSTGTYGSIRDIWLHIAQCEESFAFRFTGKRPERSLRGMASSPGFAVLREQLQQSGEDLLTIAEQLDPKQVLPVEYDGHPHDLSASTVLIQALVHGIDHRSQIATLLSQQGMVPPEIDGWSYLARAIQTPRSPTDESIS